MKEHYNKVLRDSDARVARFMEIQILDGTTRFLADSPRRTALRSRRWPSII